MNRNRWSLIVFAVVMMSWGLPAAAQQPASMTKEDAGSPWAQGVSVKNQEAARELFLKGNAQLKGSDFKTAVEYYRQSLTLWDHPAIHYNLVLAMALLGFDQPLDMHRHLVSALRYGAAPFDPQKFEYAQGYKRRLEEKLVQLEILCDKPGAMVTMDGQLLFMGPGRFEGLVPSGTRLIVATQRGYEPTSVSREFKPGEKLRISLKLLSENDVIRHQSPWPMWQPWAVVGSGIALLAGGGLLHGQVREDYRAFDAGILKCGNQGCIPDSQLDGFRSRGDSLQRVAVGSYAGGGAAVLTGAVLLYLNRPQPQRIIPGQSEEAVRIEPLEGSTTGTQMTTRN
jgi:hypothetical protein